MENYETIERRAIGYLRIASTLDSKILYSDSCIHDDVENWVYLTKLECAKTRALEGFNRQLKLLPNSNRLFKFTDLINIYSPFLNLNELYIKITN